MLNYLGGLKKRFDHIKTSSDESDSYEPAIVIVHHGKPGKSFIILQSAYWKYIDPKDNLDAEPSDAKEFQELVNKNLRIIQLTKHFYDSPSRKEALLNIAHTRIAGALRLSTGIMLCVCYNLIKCLTMFDIEVSPQSAAQLLMFIQDGLDDLKNMPEIAKEEKLVAGEVTLFEGSRKIATKDLTVSETDLIIEGGGEGEA